MKLTVLRYHVPKGMVQRTGFPTRFYDFLADTMFRIFGLRTPTFFLDLHLIRRPDYHAYSGWEYKKKL